MMGDETDDGGVKTFEGYATPGLDEAAGSEERPVGFDERTVVDPPGAKQALAAGSAGLAPRTAGDHDDQPLVEIEVFHQHGPAPRMQQPAQTLEVWTQNRIYTMDPSQTCVAVTDRKSGREDPEHPFLGFRLVGGQHRDGESFELSFPFPRPGTEAVFEHPNTRRGNFSRTSTVTRVVLRLHVVTVAQSHVVPTWTDITDHERGDAR